MNTLFNSVKHFFIPTKENEYRAGSLQIHMLSTYLVVAIVLVFVSKNTTLFANVLGVATDITVQALETDTNAVRTQAGLKPLALNDELSAAATKKAANMFQENYWAHFGPNGERPWDFIKQSGYQYEFAGENLAKNFLFSRNVVDAWMNSPTHRENVLRKEYTDVGYAVVNGMLNGEETTLVVQMFGTPLVKTVEARPVTSLPEKVAPHLAKTAPAVQPTSTHLAYNINLIFVAFIVIAVILDLIFAAKLDILHMRSKHIAHLIFLGFIGLALLMLFKNGAIM
jgi:uncharacterized protein YkwD